MHVITAILPDITLEIKPVNEQQDTRPYYLTIHDNGPGITIMYH